MPDVRNTSDYDDPEVDELDDFEDFDDDEDEDIDDDTIVITDDDDDFSDADISMEVNVEKLVAELEKAGATDIHRRAEIRRRLEELVDDGDFEDTYAIEFDD